MECSSSGFDMTKVYSETLNFLIQERQKPLERTKSPVSSEKDFGKTSMVEPFVRTRSNSPIGSGFESYEFKNDVMFSSASMSEANTDRSSVSANSDSISSGNSLMYTRFGQNLSSDLSVSDIKQEHMSDDESNVDDAYYPTNSQTVFPGMMSTCTKNTRDLGINSAQSEISKNNVAYVIKQEPLTDDDDANDTDVGGDVFGEVLLKNEIVDDVPSEQVSKEEEDSPKKQKKHVTDVGKAGKRAKRKATGKMIEMMGKDYHLDNGDGEGAKESDPEEYTPSSEQQKNIDVKKTDQVQAKTLFSFENLKGNILNIEGTPKKMHVKIFKCTECSSIFTYESVFKKHMKKHTGDMPFKCKHCGLGFNTQFSHDLHSRMHTSDRRYKCGICGQKMKLKKELKEHNISHVLTKKAQEVSSNLAVKNDPMTTEDGTVSLLSVKSEIKSLVELSPFGCSICDFVAKDFAEIGNHVMEIHFVEMRCFCDVCSRRFSNNDDLKLHKALHNDQMEEIICGICEEVVDSKADLMKHLDIHPEAKPYKCCHCGSKFIVLPQLQAHMQTHSFSKRYNCTYCLKQFFHEDTLENHLRVHTGEVAYKCSVCNKGFRAKDRLTRHKREHGIYTVDLPLPYQMYLNEPNISSDMAANSVYTDKGNGIKVAGTSKVPEINQSEEQVKSSTDNLESSSPDWKKELGCNVDVSGTNSYLSQLKRRSKKKTDVKSESSGADDIKDKTSPDGVEDMMESEKKPANFGTDQLLTGSSTLPTLFERMKSLDSTQNSSTNATGTPFSISVKKLTMVMPKNQKNSGKDLSVTSKNQSFEDNEKTMRLKMNIHQCKVCGAMFAYNNMLQKHMKKHTGEEPYKCETCGRGFISLSSMKSHSRIHTGEKPYICDVCQRAFRQKKGLKSHMQIHNVDNMNPHVCDVCNKSFRQASQLQEHWQIHATTTPFACSMCDVYTKDVSSIMAHVNTSHFKGREHACEICCQRFDTTTKLQSHLSTHEGYLELECGVCQKKYTDVKEMQKHLNDHPDAKPYKCVMCNARFCSVSQFSFHVETHTKDLHGCPQCDYKCSTVHQLVLHRKSHFLASASVVHKTKDQDNSGVVKGQEETEESPGSERVFPCKYCDQVFSTGAQRWFHTATHENTRPYSCSVCGKGYINKGCLESHEQSHKLDNSKELTCPHCGETFGRKMELARHCKRKHKDIAEESPKQAKRAKLSVRIAKPKRKKTSRGILHSEEGMECEVPESYNTHKQIKTEPVSLGYGTFESASNDIDEGLSQSACSSSGEIPHIIDGVYIKQESVSDEYTFTVSQETDNDEGASIVKQEPEFDECTFTVSQETENEECASIVKQEPESGECTFTVSQETENDECANMVKQEPESGECTFTVSQETENDECANIVKQEPESGECTFNEMQETDNELVVGDVKQETESDEYTYTLCQDQDEGVGEVRRTDSALDQSSTYSGAKLGHDETYEQTPDAQEEFICTECGANFWKKHELNKHIRKKHNETTKVSFKSKLKKIQVKNNTVQT